MNGTHLVLMLAHLFRKYGCPIPVEKAVYILSFGWRYSSPSSIRKMLTLSEDLELISLKGDMIQAEFLYNTQELLPNQCDMVRREKIETDTVNPLY
jgi:hypothetical protein